MIGIVVVGYNSKADLKSCFDSIYKSSYKKIKLIFVDNGSTDESLEFVEKTYKQAIVISNKNTGYAGGNNIGIKKALKLKCQYVLLLNPDTILERECIANLVKSANQNTILQPLILIYENGKKSNLINTTGNHLNYLGISYCSNYRQKAELAKESEIASASGAGMLVPSSIIKKVGLFDENFFMYHEDLDLNWRARKAGFEVKLIPSAKLYHKYKFSKNKLKYFYIERNRYLFILKNYEVKTILLILPFLLLNEVLMILYSMLDGWFLLKLKSIFSFYRHLPQALTLRGKAPKAVTDKKLKKYWSGAIEFSEIKLAPLKFYSLISKAYFFIIKPLI